MREPRVRGEALVPQTILERVAAGEASAIEECLAQYSALVWSLTRRFSMNPTDAEDAVQEIFVEIWRKAAQFDPSMSAESTYITMIARRRLIDRYRKTRRALSTTPLQSSPEVAEAVAPDQVEFQEQVSLAREQMSRLRPEERKILELSFDHGMSQSEIAQATNLPLGTVKTHARRGLIRLRDLLAASSHNEDGSSQSYNQEPSSEDPS